jgi:hypothetical protein
MHGKNSYYVKYTNGFVSILTSVPIRVIAYDYFHIHRLLWLESYINTSMPKFSPTACDMQWRTENREWEKDRTIISMQTWQRGKKPYRVRQNFHQPTIKTNANHLNEGQNGFSYLQLETRIIVSHYKHNQNSRALIHYVMYTQFRKPIRYGW